jgi:hypothetical protein
MQQNSTKTKAIRFSEKIPGTQATSLKSILASSPSENGYALSSARCSYFHLLYSQLDKRKSNVVQATQSKAEFKILFQLIINMIILFLCIW